MNNDLAFDILKYGGIGYNPEQLDEAKAIVKQSLDAVEGYRRLFSFIKNSDPKLEYSCEELAMYQKEIEAGNWADDQY